MMNRLRFLANALRVQLAWSPTLTRLGILGIALGAVCAAAGVIRGVEIPPEGNLFETASFDLAVGFFTLTLVVLAPVVTWKPRGKRRWVVFLTAVTLYAYAIETVQAFRGLDPRTSQIAGPLDQMAGGLFFLAAQGILISFIVLAVKFFMAEATLINLAVRYGAVASFVAFGVGEGMSLVTQGRHVGEAGNLLFLHAAGFHGLQAIPLLGLLLTWAKAPESTTRRNIHVAGLVWLGACLAIAWQSISGRSVVELAPATAAAALFFLAWLFFAVVAIRSWLGSELLPQAPTN